jgi:hypothetical protein
MSLLNALLIFLGGFASVFTLGFQSRAVNAGNYLVAAMMSFVVAMSQAHLWVLIVDGDGSLASSMVYGASGMCAITSAMFIHQRFFTKKNET